MSDQEPQKEGLGGVLLGLLLTCVLHGVASIVVIGVGSASSKEGGLMVIVFWALIGAAQWVYLLPAGLIARKLGWTGVTKGVWIGGGVGTLLSAGCWGLMALGNLPSLFR